MRESIPTVKKGKSIKEAMRCIQDKGLGIVFVLDKAKLYGVVTDGDIRRAILKGIDVGEPVDKIANRKPFSISANWSNEKIRAYLNEAKIQNEIPREGVLKLPVVNNRGRILDIICVSRPDKNRVEVAKQLKSGRGSGQVNKVLVIGGSGYLGSVLVRQLLANGFKVRVLDNLMYGSKGTGKLITNRDFELIRGDIRNVSSVVNSIKGVDAVIHLAAIVGDPACAVNPQETIEINCLAMYNIIEACKFFLINRLIFASTCSVYGISPDDSQELTEDSPLNPVSLYAKSKVKCEEKIFSSIDGHFSPTVLRMATLYGYSANMRFDLVANLLVAKAYFEKEITIFGGSQWRPFVDLEDAASAYVKCLRAPLDKVGGKVFNVASENLRLSDLGRAIRRISPGAKLKIDTKLGDKRNYRVSIDKIAHSIGFKPKMKMKEVLVEIRKKIESGEIKDYLHPDYRSALPQI